MKKKINEALTILIDNREKIPYEFNGYGCKTEQATLKTGDYSLKGFENKIVIERKSREDLNNSIGNDRERFEREFTRLASFDYPVLVVEDSLAGLTQKTLYSKMHPHAIINSLISWGIKYGVQIYFGENRKLSECLVYRILEKYLYNSQKREKRECVTY